MEERRKIERTAVDEIAHLVGDGASIRCRVVNISSHGCAIEIHFPAYVLRRTGPSAIADLSGYLGTAWAWSSLMNNLNRQATYSH